LRPYECTQAAADEVADAVGSGLGVGVDAVHAGRGPVDVGCGVHAGVDGVHAGRRVLGPMVDAGVDGVHAGRRVGVMVAGRGDVDAVDASRAY